MSINILFHIFIINIKTFISCIMKDVHIYSVSYQLYFLMFSDNSNLDIYSFADTGYRVDFVLLPVRRLRVLQARLLEWEKPILCTVSSQLSHRFLCKQSVSADAFLAASSSPGWVCRKS